MSLISKVLMEFEKLLLTISSDSTMSIVASGVSLASGAKIGFGGASTNKLVSTSIEANINSDDNIERITYVSLHISHLSIKLKTDYNSIPLHKPNTITLINRISRLMQDTFEWFDMIQEGSYTEEYKSLAVGTVQNIQVTVSNVNEFIGWVNSGKIIIEWSMDDSRELPFIPEDIVNHIKYRAQVKVL